MPFSIDSILASALARRRHLLADPTTTAHRILHSEADGVPGLFIDRLGAGATLIRHIGIIDPALDPRELAETVLEQLAPFGGRAVYDKPFVRDRSALGGEFDSTLTSPTPLAGEPLPESITVLEHGRAHEVHLFDGFSTGLFLDQRSTRAWVHEYARKNPGLRVLNTFAYTGAFSVAAALAGAATTTVDVSPRYLDWAKRNFALNSIDPAAHHFARMGTFEFLSYAQRKHLQYDLIILDPPTFSAGNKRRSLPPWSATRDYPRLIREAARVLAPRGIIFASTNTAELCRPGALERMIEESLGTPPRWLEPPPPPADFPGDHDRAHWRIFTR